MIVTPRFVFLHLHKSGGTFVNEGLLRHEPGARQIGYHLPRALLPAEFSRLPVIGLVRSPCSYYVSWYAFQAAREEPNALYRVLSEGGRAGFAATIRNMLALGSDGALLDRAVAALPREYTHRGLNLPGPALEAIRGTGVGFYSFLHEYLYGGAADLHVARMERLREELPEVMTIAGAPPGDALLAYLREAAPRNMSRHDDTPARYDAPLRALVAARDATVIERYGYAAG